MFSKGPKSQYRGSLCKTTSNCFCVSVHVCMCACVRACMHACVCYINTILDRMSKEVMKINVILIMTPTYTRQMIFCGCLQLGRTSELDCIHQINKGGNDISLQHCLTSHLNISYSSCSQSISLCWLSLVVFLPESLTVSLLLVISSFNF